MSEGRWNEFVRRVALVLVSNRLPIRPVYQWAACWRARGGVIVEVNGCADITQARGAAASAWLARHQQEWSLWIDDDIEVDAAELEEFILGALRRWDSGGAARRESIIAGVYAVKAPASHYLTARFLREDVRLLEGGGYEPIAGCGFGLVMAHRSAFEAIGKALPLVEYNVGKHSVVGRPYFISAVAARNSDPEGPRIHLGEDFSFCLRALDQGQVLLADTRVRIWHHGSYAYGLEDADSTVRRWEFVLLGHRGASTSCGPSPDVAELLRKKCEKVK